MFNIKKKRETPKTRQTNIMIVSSPDAINIPKNRHSINIGLHSKSAGRQRQYIHMSIKPPVQTLLDLIRFM